MEAIGDHKTLLKTSATYKKLYEKEAKEVEDEIPNEDNIS